MTTVAVVAAFALVGSLAWIAVARARQRPAPEQHQDAAAKTATAKGPLLPSWVVITLAIVSAGALLRGMTSSHPLLALPALGLLAWLAWLVLFSGRQPTGIAQARARVWHWLFVAFFVSYTFGLVMWLIAAFIPAVAHNSDALHERMHAFGGAPAILKVEASEVAPFSIEGSSRIHEMTLRSGGLAQIEFRVHPIEVEGVGGKCVHACDKDGFGPYVALAHNVSIYTQGGDALFEGASIAPSIPGPAENFRVYDAVRVYEFDAPPPGLYEYRCDIHPVAMRGTVRVLDANVPLTDPDHPGLRDMTRRIAEVSHSSENLGDVALDYGFSAVSLGLGIFLVLLRPRERMARVFGVAMIGTAAAYNLQSHAALAVHNGFDLLHVNLHPITGITYIYALVLFPDGRLVPQFSNRFVRIAYRFVVFVAAMILLGVTGSILPDFNQHPAALVLTFGMIIPVIGIVAQSYRLRRPSSSESRQQSRLLLIALATSLAFGVALLLALGIDLGALVHPNAANPLAIGVAESRAFRVFQPLFVVIPLALFAGILRYRLWDIDLVISKTLVYGALAAFVAATYVGLVVGLGGTTRERAGLSIAVTVLVAVVFDPLRTRLQRVANRLVYGERATPYEVMAEISRRLADPAPASQVLPGVAEAVARGVGAARARVRLFLPDGGERAAVWPAQETDAAFDRSLPLAHAGEPVGELAISKRPGDPLRVSENRLLETLGSQLALALHSVRLAERLRGRLDDLQRAASEIAASRHRIVSVRDVEQSRLESQIRERVEDRLVAIGATLERAEQTIDESRSRGVALVDDAATQANEVQDSLRDVARGIFPPLLADRGVVPALESQARKLGARIVVKTAGIPGRYGEHAEAAVYFCCVEAVRASSRRGSALPVDLEFGAEEGWVTFSVRDRAGLGSAAIMAADLQVMVDRIEAVGGRLELHASSDGTTVSGRVPVPATPGASGDA